MNATVAQLGEHPSTGGMDVGSSPTGWLQLRNTSFRGNAMTAFQIFLVLVGMWLFGAACLWVGMAFQRVIDRERAGR
jgi:hypothetical protein